MWAGNRILRTLGVIAAVSILATACTTTTSPSPATQKRGGGYYKDDGPGTSSEDLTKIPDATPRAEPLRSRNNQPYRALGKTYTPRTRVEPFRQRGVASWYGRRFHGRPTASGERYNMYAMTAAHPTLPIPSYARVTSLANGRSVVVRINDRGPFLHSRIIDLSYAAASKLGYVNKGSAQVEVEQIMSGHETPTQKTEPIPDENSLGSMAASREKAENTTPAPGMEHVPDAVPVTSAETTQNSNAGAVSDGQRLFLQLGVFVSRVNAETFRSRVSALVPELSANTEVLPDKGYFRVYTGPFASPADARTAAERIEEQMGIQPFTVRRD